MGRKFERTITKLKTSSKFRRIERNKNKEEGKKCGKERDTTQTKTHTAENVYNMHRTEKREVHLNKNSEKIRGHFLFFRILRLLKNKKRKKLTKTASEKKI